MLHGRRTARAMKSILIQSSVVLCIVWKYVILLSTHANTSSCKNAPAMHVKIYEFCQESPALALIWSVHWCLGVKFVYAAASKMPISLIPFCEVVPIPSGPCPDVTVDPPSPFHSLSISSLGFQFHFLPKIAALHSRVSRGVLHSAFSCTQSVLPHSQRL